MNSKTSVFFKEDGVYISESTVRQHRDFEKQYLSIRSREQRILDDELVKGLPAMPDSHPDHSHWKIRRHNIKRFLRYLSKRKKQRILDVGAGNGFLSNLMAMQGHQVTGLDVNLQELKQAARIFGSEHVHWYCADIFEEEVTGPFDLIVFCCSVQYFNDLSKLIERCKNLLNESGEIHIIDTPFYDEKDVLAAKERSKQYFKKNQTPEMASYYFHHSLKELEKFGPRYLYRPGWLNKFIQDSPFCWIKIS